jgi:hypothetical protein
MATITCACPPKAEGEPRHPDGDTVNLRTKLDSRSALAMRWSVIQLKADDPDASVAEILGVMSEQYLLHGIESWTLVDEKGKPLPCTKANIRTRILAQDLEAIMPVVEEADELYMGIVILPLAAGASTSSPGSQTDASTSPPTESEPTPLKRSRRSSTTTSRTAATATTSPSPDGDSNSSPSSASAA